VAPLAEVRVRRERRRGPAVVVAEPTLLRYSRVRSSIVSSSTGGRRINVSFAGERARTEQSTRQSGSLLLSPSEKRDRMTSGTAIVQVGVVVIAVPGLWIGARALVDATVRVARRFGVGELTIGLTIVAMGTSTPELVVTVDAALAGLGGSASATSSALTPTTSRSSSARCRCCGSFPSSGRWSTATAPRWCSRRSSVPPLSSIGR